MLSVSFLMPAWMNVQSMVVISEADCMLAEMISVRRPEVLIVIDAVIFHKVEMMPCSK